MKIKITDIIKERKKDLQLVLMGMCDK